MTSKEPLDLPEPTRLKQDWDRAPLDPRRVALSGFSFYPWRRRPGSDVVEATCHIPGGPRRYRVLERREPRRYSREVRRVEYLGDDVVVFDPPAEGAKAFMDWLRSESLARFEPDPEGRHPPERPALLGYATLPDRGEDAWPSQPRVETSEGVARVPLLPGAEELTPRQEAIAALMRRPPGERNFGRVAAQGARDAEETRFGDPSAGGRLDRRGRRVQELDFERWDDQDFLAGKQGHGWGIEYVRTGQPNGRPPTWPRGVPARVTDALVRAVSVAPAEYARLTRRGGRPRTRGEVAGRVELGCALARVMRAGREHGVEEALLATYGGGRDTLYRLVRLAAAGQCDENP